MQLGTPVETLSIGERQLVEIARLLVRDARLLILDEPTATLSKPEIERVFKLGDRLALEGYRGFLEIDYLADVDSGELYLGEINPRISGVTSMTNVTAGAYADAPLFLFHLLEYLDVDYEIDVDDINRRWAEASSVDVWSQIILKQNREGVEHLTEAPKTGIWRSTRPAASLRPLGTRLAQPPRRARGVLPARARRRATTATRAPISACSSRARACRPTTTS